MLGAIAGDIIGSVHEFSGTKTTDFELFPPESRFTDDTVLTVALADSIMTGENYAILLKKYFFSFPGRGYGGGFADWARSKSLEPYNSYGNGAAMRTSPVGFAFNTLEEVLRKAAKYSSVTHNHPEGIKGAQATSAAIFLARMGASKGEIKDYVQKQFGYDLSKNCDEIRKTYRFNETCQETVPQAITAFLDSSGFEHAIRLAISLGGDADTLGAITGGIAEAFYGVPADIEKQLFDRLDPSLEDVVRKFRKKYQAKSVTY
jgi:ADP-ribosylglycohydrolase